jgi:hypothetical protein
MSIAVYFHPKGMTLQQFEETHRRLAQAGAAEPEGRIHHSCFGEDGDLMVYDIWESPETFQAFGGTLMPILGRAWNRCGRALDHGAAPTAADQPQHRIATQRSPRRARSFSARSEIRPRRAG